MSRDFLILVPPQGGDHTCVHCEEVLDRKLLLGGTIPSLDYMVMLCNCVHFTEVECCWILFRPAQQWHINTQVMERQNLTLLPKALERLGEINSYAAPTPAVTKRDSLLK